MILNISSQGGRVVFPVTGAYHASKFALEALSDALRVELAPWACASASSNPAAATPPIWSKGEAHGNMAGDEAQHGEYRKLIEAYKELSTRTAQNGFPPQQFAELVERILQSSSSRARYQLGRGVGFIITLRRLLPDWAWDAWVRRLYRW
jgi:NAD(P)-dependent dehydrogenase (short-subunit alcohol dehydrogenase family)